MDSPDKPNNNSKTAEGSDISLDRDQDERLVHVEKEDERVKHFGDRRFEKIMMGVGIAIVVIMFMLIFLFYKTVEVRNADEETLASQIEKNFFGKYISDKDYLFEFKVNATTYDYDPLLNETTEAVSAQGIGPVSSKSTGGFRVNPGDRSAILNGSGKEVLSLGDPAVAINTVLVSPDGNSVIFDTEPADAQAKAKYGLRLGAYELHLEDDRFETLVSDASVGIDAPEYLEHFVQILSISPNGRYVAYTNRSTLRLYDRLSGATVLVKELSSPSIQPDTGWSERPIAE